MTFILDPHPTTSLPTNFKIKEYDHNYGKKIERDYIEILQRTINEILNAQQ